MRSIMSLLIFTSLVSAVLSSRIPKYPSALNGQHISIIWTRWEGNPKGLSGPVKGGFVIDYLADRFNFTYSMVRVAENRFEPVGKEKGLFNYLWDKQSDFLLHDIIPTSQRAKLVDLAFPFTNHGTFGFLIPVPDSTVNLAAIIEPFQLQVWSLILISMICVIAVLEILVRILKKKPFSLAIDSSVSLKKSSIGSQYLYVFGNVLSQGGPCQSKRLSFRMVAGIWTLAAFVLVQAYTSTLFNFVLQPASLSPLIDSVYDIIEKPGVNLMVKRGGTLDTTFATNNQSSLYIKLNNKLNAFSESRCALVSDCIKLVQPGSNNVFSDGTIYQLDAIRDRFVTTGNCNLQLARNTFFPLIITVALQKNSPYTREIALGCLELMENGILAHWDLWFRKWPSKCNPEDKKRRNSKKKEASNLQPITLQNLTGIFVIYAGGFLLSILAFFGEYVFSRF